LNKINHAIISFDEGSTYADLWPYVSRCWLEVCGIKAIAFVVSDESSDFIEDEFGLIKKVKAEEGFPISIQSQLLRLYCYKYFLDTELSCIISDADMLTINSNFINSGVSYYKENCIVSYYRHLIGNEERELAMCYNMSKVCAFIKILNLNKFKTFKDFLSFLSVKYKAEYETKNSHKQKFGWNIDQRYMWDCMQNNKELFITPTPPFDLIRLDRGRWPDLKDEDIINHRYNDCHFFNDGLNNDRVNLLNKLINLSK
jgi:hypothetical protein